MDVEEPAEVEERKAPAGKKLKLKAKKKGPSWWTVTPAKIGEWKRAGAKRRRMKLKAMAMRGANKSRGLPKSGKPLLKVPANKRGPMRRARQIALLRAPVGDGKQITLPPKNVLAVAMPKVAPPRLEALLGLGNYRRIARASGFTPQHISNVLNKGRNCTFWAAAQIADAAGVTLDELRVYTEIVRNALGGGIPTDPRELGRWRKSPPRPKPEKKTEISTTDRGKGNR